MFSNPYPVYEFKTYHLKIKTIFHWFLVRKRRCQSYNKRYLWIIESWKITILCRQFYTVYWKSKFCVFFSNWWNWKTVWNASCTHCVDIMHVAAKSNLKTKLQITNDKGPVKYSHLNVPRRCGQLCLSPYSSISI